MPAPELSSRNKTELIAWLTKRFDKLEKLIIDLRKLRVATNKLDKQTGALNKAIQRNKQP